MEPSFGSFTEDATPNHKIQATGGNTSALKRENNGAAPDFDVIFEDCTMDENQFPEIILNLPKADIPVKGLSSYLLQGKEQQILFMEFEKNVEVPEHSHEAQWGAVLSGEIVLIIEGRRNIFKKGDTYFIPAGVKHSAQIKAGYKDITLFNQKDRYQEKYGKR